VKINLYIPIEVKNRELHAKILLAKHAAERGFNVILGRKNDLNDLVVHMPAGIYFGLGAFENFKHFYAKLKRQGFAIVVNEEEGLVTYSDKMYVDMRVSGATLEHIDELFTWGVENQRVLSDAFPEFSKKFKVTGNPRFDLLKPQNQRVYSAEMNDIADKYGRFVLVCTSFSSINHFDKNLDYLQSLIDKKTLRSKESIENFKRYREIKKATFNSFLEAIPKLAAVNSSINIVIRPHPSENIEIYKVYEEKFSNVHVDNRFSVHPWIIMADALVHHYCTTSIEALAVNTPRFALRPVRDALSEKEIPFSCSTECASVDTLIEQISGCLETGKVNWKVKPLTQDYSCYVSNIGDRLAAAAIVDSMSRLLNSEGLQINKNHFTFHAGMLLAKIRYMAKKILRSAIRREGKNLHYVNHKFMSLSYDEVVNIFGYFEPGTVRLECRKYAGDFINVFRSMAQK
jgi:surface carbohydrate biosynthesis protein